MEAGRGQELPAVTSALQNPWIYAKILIKEV